MAWGLNRIWVRFGLWISAAVLASIGLLVLSVLGLSEWQYRDFYRSLPSNVQTELSELQAAGQEDSVRAQQIYLQYWRGDQLFGEKMSLLIGLVICLPVGLLAGFWVSRQITRPLDSIAEAALRVAQGNLSVRAHTPQVHGEMAEMVQHFNRMIDALETLEHERRVTAASISHELRTPITVLQARLHGICDGVIRADQQEFHTLLGQVQHLGRLVGDLHTLSVAAAGQLSLHLDRFDLAELAQVLVHEHAPRLSEQGIVLQLEVPDAQAGCDIEADADRMHQIFANLIDNVLRHAADGGWIGVKVRAEAQHVSLSVGDAGPGLPPSIQNHPFQRFAQLPGQRRREGSGLGLSIVKTLTELQGGEVLVGTSERGGTEVTVRFPQA